MNNDTVEFVLFDTDLTTALGILPAGSMKLDLILNEPGSGEVKIPLKSRAAGLVTSTMFASGKYRGNTRGGFFVENIGKDIATGGENEAQWLSMSGRGALALLDDAMVDYDGTSATTRDLSGTRAGMLIDLIAEAQARGALQNLGYDFTDTLDSDGNAWSDNDPLKWTVGTSLLDVARQISKIGIDFDIVPDGVGGFVLSAFKNGKGSDKSETVYFRVGVNCEEVSSLEAGGEIRNALRVGYKSGYTAVSDSASITTYRRREKLLDARTAQTPAAALTYGSAELSMNKNPKTSITVKIYDGKGPRAFVDYALGDSITLDIKGVETTYRVRGMQLAWDGAKFADVVVDLNSIILENEIRVAQDVGWLLDEWATARDADLLAVSFWAAIGGVNSEIYHIRAFAWLGNKLIVVGSFLIIGGINCNGIAVYDTDTGIWSDDYPGNIQEVYSVCVVGTDIYIGTGDVKLWDAGTGAWTTKIKGSGYLNSMVSDGSKLYVCSNSGMWDFPPFNDAYGWYGGLLALDFSTDIWSPINDYGGKRLVMVGSNLYYLWIPGVGDEVAVSVYNGSSWTQLGANFDADGYDMVARGSEIIVCGRFTGYISIWNGSAWNTLDVSPGGIVRGIATYLTDIYAVGQFTAVGNHIAKYSGGEWQMLENGLDAVAYVVTVKNNDVYVGGDFTTAGTKTANKIASYFNNFEAMATYLENSSTFNVGAAIHNAAASAITDNDEVPFWEDVSKALRKITWANLWLAIKAKADLIYVALTGNQTIAGIKTFTSFPITPSSAPSADYEVANKKYVDDNGGSVAREVLTANRTYYVATTGNNSNNGLTAGTPFLTTQKAIDVCAATLDFAGYTVTIQIADGTYTSGTSIKAMVGMASPASLVVQGNATTPANVLINVSGGIPFTVSGPQTQCYIKNLKVQGSIAFNVLFGTLYWSGVVFGACSAYHFNANKALIMFQGSGGYTIAGGAATHLYATSGSLFWCEGVGTVTLSGTPAFTTFVIADNTTNVRINGNTYSGGATGSRYSVSANAVIFTNGGGATYLPGNTAGAASTGGLYV
jgi:hypothetical protein